MCYEATIASAGGDEATFTKSLTMSIEDDVANFLSCAQREKETLPNFY
jgi:hypothetical protein